MDGWMDGGLPERGRRLMLIWCRRRLGHCWRVLVNRACPDGLKCRIIRSNYDPPTDAKWQQNNRRIFVLNSLSGFSSRHDDDKLTRPKERERRKIVERTTLKTLQKKRITQSVMNNTTTETGKYKSLRQWSPSSPSCDKRRAEKSELFDSFEAVVRSKLISNHCNYLRDRLARTRTYIHCKAQHSSKREKKDWSKKSWEFIFRFAKTRKFEFSFFSFFIPGPLKVPLGSLHEDRFVGR